MREKSFEDFVNNKIMHLSKSRKDTIITACNWVDEFCQKTYGKSLESIISDIKKSDEPEDEAIEIIQDWINTLDIKTNSRKNYASGFNRYLRYRNIRIDLRDIEWPQELSEERYAISLEEIQEIINVASWRRKGYYLALISTGARPIEICGLRKKDFVLFDGKYKAIIPAHLTKKKIARTIFFSSEVTPYISTLIKKINDDDPVFGTNKDPSRARQTEDVLFLRYIKKLGFTQKYETTGYFKLNLYCFRGYFFTKVLDHFRNDIAHAMIGHGAYIQQYQRRTDQQKKDLWDEAESEILIFDTAKKDQKIKQLTQTANTVDELRSQLKFLSERLRITNEKMEIIESELPNYKITRIKESTNPKVLDPDTKFYV